MSDEKGCCKGGCVCKMVAKVLLIVGGLNWGLVGIGMFFSSNFNLVNLIFGFSPTIEAIVYVLVGVAAVMKIFGCRCAKCKEARANCASCHVDSSSAKVE